MIQPVASVDWLADGRVVLLTLDVGVRSISLSLPCSVLISLLLSFGSFRGRAILDLLVHLPLVLPPVLVGWFLLLAFGVHGPLGGLLHNLFNVRLVFTTWGAALACAVMALPLMVRALRLSLEAIDLSLLQTAQTLGAYSMDRVFTIMMPLAAPGLVTAMLIGLAASFGEFGAVITFAANIPGKTQTLSLAIYSALQVPDGEATAARLSLESIGLSVTILLAADRSSAWLNRRIGR